MELSSFLVEGIFQIFIYGTCVRFLLFFDLLGPRHSDRAFMHYGFYLETDLVIAKEFEYASFF